MESPPYDVGAALSGTAWVKMAGGADETVSTVRTEEKFEQSLLRRKSFERVTLAYRGQPTNSSGFQSRSIHSAPHAGACRFTLRGYPRSALNRTGRPL